MALAEVLATTPDSQRRRESKVSVHLEYLLGKEFKLPVNVGSVDFLLTSPFDQRFVCKNVKSKEGNLAPSAGNLASVTMKIWVNMLKIQSEGNILEWDAKILVISSRRLFILSRITFNFFEIGDSIPVQEILSVDIVQDVLRRNRASLCNPANLWKHWRPGAPKNTHFHCSTAAFCTGQDAESEEHIRRLAHKYEALLLDSGAAKMCLRITTAPGGFNEGQPYYLKLSRFSQPRQVSEPPPPAGCGILPSKPPIRIVMEEIRQLAHALRATAAFQDPRAAAETARAAAAVDAAAADDVTRPSSLADAGSTLWQWTRA
jgi:hypothetical protein